ncbi:MAG: TonB-dependent receptor domain-containing protein [Bryobacteraceae bacterium]
MYLKCAFALALSVCSAVAQSTTSTLAGVVKDSSGAAVPKAAVQVINEESGVALGTTTNEAGLYRVAALIPGVYRVEVEAAGFQKLLRGGISVQIAQTLQVDLVLQVGNVLETINVTAASPVLEAQTSSVGQLVERQMIAGMPMPNRTSTALIALIPGATIRAVTGDIPEFSVAGGRMRNQQFTMDGGNHTNTVGLAVNQSQVPLPMDAMQEFRVIANSYSAEYGQSQSGVVTLATRSGTNDWHGNLFEYAQNEALNARNFFAASRPKFRQHQFGGSVGGPIIRDRTHFFVTYERTQQVTGGPGFWTVPSLRQREGDFSQTFNAQGRLIQIYDPATTQRNVRQPFPGNIIPANRIDPVSRAILPYFVEPNLPGNIAGANNFGQNSRPTMNRNIVVGRVDHQFNAANQLMVRYFIADTHNANPGLAGERAADPSAATRTDQKTHNLLGSWTHTFRSNLLNDVRFGMVRRDYFNQRVNKEKDYAAKLGLKGVSGVAFPIINISGFTALSGAPFRFSSPLLDWHIQESVSWFRGRHALKIGMEARIGEFNDDTDTSSSGNFTFGTLMTGLPNTSGTGNAFATFLLGEVDNANMIRPDPIRSRASYWGAFLQDDWRLNARLTLNLGLRWEGTRPRTEDNNRMNAFDMTAINPVSKTPGVVTFAGRGGVPRSAYDFDANNFGPRVGFAWSVREKTVVRGGAGIIYGSSVNAIVGTAAALGFTTDYRLTSPEPGITSAMRLREGFPAFTRPTIEQLGAGYGAVPVGSPPTPP